jgi:hypothetical protein
MSRSASRRWTAACLLGIAAWIGVTVLAGVLADDPTDPKPTLIAFAAGGTAFFGAIFGYSLWRVRRRPEPELDALLRELSLEPGGSADIAASIGAPRRLVQAYLVGGTVVTALGLAAIWQEALDAGSPRLTLYALGVVVIAWAAATPAIVGWARRQSGVVLAPLGLTQSRGSATLAGERHGRPVGVEITSKGSVTRVIATAAAPSLDGAEILAYTGRGSERIWDDVGVESDGATITVRRAGHEGPAWLWDLWLAERLADAG